MSLLAQRARGSVEILCREIGFQFSPGMENPRLLIAFVRRLAIEVAEMRWQQGAIAARIGGDAPSGGSGELLDKVLDMLNGDDVVAMVGQCAELHDLAHCLKPEDAYPTDHLIDMLVSCVSAIRFGCDPGRWGVGSRHAAEAAQHVWGQRYGVALFDQHTPRWENDWARNKLQEALIALAFPPSKGPDECPAQGTEARTHGAPRSGGERCVTAAALDTPNPDAVTTAGRG